MGFTNFLRDLGSAAAPFALTVGANALVPGGGGLAAALKGTNLLTAIGAGAGGFARNEQEERLRKAQKQQGKNQSMANLINTLNPRANYQARQAALPSPGTLETLASGTQQGIQAFRMADALRRQNAATDSAQTLTDAKIAALRGSDDAARRGMEEVTTSGPAPVANAVQMPVQTVTAEAPKEAPPLGYLSGAAAERRLDRAQDIRARGNEVALEASQAKMLQAMQEQLRLASLVTQDPSTFQNLEGSGKRDAALGLAMMGPRGLGVLSNVSGRPMPSDLTTKISEGMQARASIAEADGIIKQLTAMGDTGFFGTFNLPGGKAAELTRRLDQIFAILPSQMRNATETGVMNDKDEARWVTQIPNIRALDQASEIAAWNSMVAGVEKKYQEFGASLIDQGYNVGSMDFSPQQPATVDSSRVDVFLKRLQEIGAVQ